MARRRKLSTFWLRIAIAIASVGIVVVLWTVPRDVRFDATVTATRVAFDYHDGNDTFLTASATGLIVEYFSSITLAPGVAAGASGSRAFENGVTLRPASDSSTFAIESDVRVSEINLPRPSFVRLEPQPAETGTRLGVLVQPPRVDAAAAGCAVPPAAQRKNAFTATLTFAGNVVKLRCADCIVDGDQQPFFKDAVDYRLNEHAMSAEVQGRQDKLRLQLDLANGPLERESVDRGQICGLRLDDEGLPPDSTVVGGNLFSSAVNEGKQEIRKGTIFAVEARQPVILRDLAVQDGNLQMTIAGDARQLTLADTVVKRSLVDDLMTSRPYAAISTGLVFALFFLRVVDLFIAGKE